MDDRGSPGSKKLPGWWEPARFLQEEGRRCLNNGDYDQAICAFESLLRLQENQEVQRCLITAHKLRKALRRKRLAERFIWAVVAVLSVALSGLFFYEARQTADSVVLLDPRGLLQQAPAVFNWQPLSSARYYRLTLFGPDLRTVLWSHTTSRSQVLLPENVRQELSRMPGSEGCYWIVEAFSDSGPVRKSGIGSFRISRPP